jgi:hypothetical protein
MPYCQYTALHETDIVTELGLLNICEPVYPQIMMKKYLSLLFTLFSLIFATTATADPFTVAGVPVDASGENAIAAQTQAITEGQRYATEILINRLTLGSERSSKGQPALDPQTIARMIRALEIANEKRSANRYLGDITVAFNPSQVQSFLRGQGFTMVSTESRPRLVLPVLEGSPLWRANEWQSVWQGDTYAHSLTPSRGINLANGSEALISSAQALSANMDSLRRVGQAYGVDQVLVAKAVPSLSGVSVTLTDVALDSGTKRNLGTVTGTDFPSAARAAVQSLENEWKSASVSNAKNAVSMTVTVLYQSHEEWLRLQDAINGSAQIQDARLDALSKDGALMTLTYGGDMSRLGNELGFKGVSIKRDPNLGVILARTGRI